MRYRTPDEHYFRIHHIRPRFKTDVENVLIYVANEIGKIPPSDIPTFSNNVNEALRQYPGNAHRTKKTIDNWRTEISSLFGFIEFDSAKNRCGPGNMAMTLAADQDLVEFFKYFLYRFQYPGGHLKSFEAIKFIKAGIRFRPVKFLLRLMLEGGGKEEGRFWVTKAEITHCIFNDLRFTSGEMNEGEALSLILANRSSNLTYDWSGDVVRYAGDILDYTVLADLLEYHNNKYYLNEDSMDGINAIVASDEYFDGYDPLYGQEDVPIGTVNNLRDDWFHYVNQKLDTDVFRTDVFKFLKIDKEEYESLPQPSHLALGELVSKIEAEAEIRTKEIGDAGEYLIHGHECMRMKIGKREDLIHLIVRIPTKLGLGYDIQSMELDASKRYIEVKTTISSKQIVFGSFHMSTNEWKTAESLENRYFVYRLLVSKNEGGEARLFIIKNPVEKYKTDKLRMIPKEGADISFYDKAGQWEDLLTWKN